MRSDLSFLDISEDVAGLSASLSAYLDGFLYLAEQLEGHAPDEIVAELIHAHYLYSEALETLEDVAADLAVL